MEDLREVGEKAIESVNKLGASDAGDLVLGIGEIIEELRGKPDLYEDKLDHLEGLFREFVYGEGYELRNNRVPEDKEDDDLYSFGTHNGFGGMVSGLINVNLPLNISGSLLPPMGLSGMSHKPWGAPPIKTPESTIEQARARDEFNEQMERLDKAWDIIVRPPRMVPVLEGVPTKKKKKTKKEFKKRWWNKQV